MFMFVKTPVLTRVTAVPAESALDARLAADAREKLGYTPMQDRLTLTRSTRELYRVLLAAGVAPFDLVTVIRYQKRVRWHRQIADAKFPALIGGAIFGAFVLTTGNGGWFDLMLAGVAALAVSGFLYFLPAPSTPGPWKWRRVWMSDYDRPIPAHVLTTALRIREAFVQEFEKSAASRNEYERACERADFLQNLSFAVDELRRDARRVDPDPFLVVYWRGVDAYIAMWDEPTFASK